MEKVTIRDISSTEARSFPDPECRGCGQCRVPEGETCGNCGRYQPVYDDTMYENARDRAER